MSRRAVLDACVLVPYNLASLLLTLGERELLELRWSDEILEETRRALTGKLDLDPERADRRLNAMRQAFPEAAVVGFEHLIEELECHPKDRHVLAAAIASGSQSIRFGGQRRPVTVLFADLVSFTTYAEQSEPEQVVAFLNELFTILTDIVFEMGGTVDKFIGDAIMVLFGATADLPDGPQRALNTAQRFHRAVKEHATAWAVKYNLNAQLSIGIHHGEVVVGNLGSTRRMEYTAIGDAINTAARLQSLARGGETLLSRAVAEYADPSIELALVGEKVLRGRRQPLTIYSLK